MERKTGLYIHVPICKARCRYCDFYKLTPDEWDDVDRYLYALELELSRLPSNFAPETVFIGGGTPTALEVNELERLLGSVADCIDLSNVVEFSSEANPGTLSRDKLMVLREGGVNRISIGAQTFNAKALRMLGRIHSADQAVEAFRNLRKAGFENINIDLIQSIPGMGPQELLDDARQCIALAPEHISYYNLIYEPGTPMTQDRDAGRIVPPGDEQEAENYHCLKAELVAAGYEHYEISNFCKPGKPCQHNVLYWQGGEYLGCGPSSHSHWNQKRFGNISDLPAYCERLENTQRPFDEVEVLDPESKARELLVMWLRMTEGVDCAAFELRTGFSVEALGGDMLDVLLDEGLLQRRGDHLALTDQALFVSNAVLSEFV